MTPRRRRLALVLGIVAGVSIAGALALSAFRQNVTFFFDPTQVTAGEVPPGEARWRPTASISSMKMMLGAAFFA